MNRTNVNDYIWEQVYVGYVHVVYLSAFNVYKK